MMADTRTRRTLSVGDGAAVAAAAWWCITLVRIARHRIFVSHDTVISYAHVWFISRRIWTDHRPPWRMPMLGYGHALAFPYGLVPWLSAGLIRPLFGDWTVTALLVIGTIGVIVTTFAAFPELRRGWWAAAVLVNPALVAGTLIGQIPFLWATSLLLLAIAAWRRGRVARATAFAAAAQLTHVAVLGPITAILVVVAWAWHQGDRQKLLRCYGISLCCALPAAIAVFASPVFSDASVAVKIGSFLGTVAPRSLLVLVPLGLTALQGHREWSWAGPASVAGLLAMLWLSWTPLGMPWAWRALDRQPDTAMTAFLSSGEFQPGATYRVLRISDGKIGMYQLIGAGGRLDAEFFPESIVRRSWPDPTSYASFLAKRHVDYVMVWNGYVEKFKVNEQQLLESVSASPGGCEAGMCVRVTDREPKYVVYRIARPSAR